VQDNAVITEFFSDKNVSLEKRGKTWENVEKRIWQVAHRLADGFSEVFKRYSRGIQHVQEPFNRNPLKRYMMFD
jgi:hypothetical protein